MNGMNGVMVSVLWMMSLMSGHVVWAFDWQPLKFVHEKTEVSMLYSSLTGKASGFKCSLPAASNQPETLLVCWKNCTKCQTWAPAKWKVLKKFPGKGLVFYQKPDSCPISMSSCFTMSCLVLFCLATTYFVLTFWLDPKSKACSFVTYDSQSHKEQTLTWYKKNINMKFSPSFPSEFHEQRLNCLDQCHSWAADLLVTLVFRLGENALHTLPSSYGSNKERKTRNHKRNNQERKTKKNRNE